MQKVAPHTVLSRYYDSAETRQGAVDEMFNASAGHYDKVISAMSFGSGAWYRRDVLQRMGLKPGMRVLDVGAGTGAVTLPAQEIVGEDGVVLAVDPSPGMLGEGVRRGIERPAMGLGEALPIADGHFDFVTMGYALRHVPDLLQTFAEYRRVLKPGGRVLLLEISRPEKPWALSALKFYLGKVVPFFSGFLSSGTEVKRLMEYYWDTIEDCVPPEVVLDTMSQAGFKDVQREVTMSIFSEYQGQA